MEAIIRDNGIKISHMGMGSIIILIRIGFIKVNGELGVSMGLDRKLILMEQFIKDNIMKISSKEMGFIYLTLNV